MSGLNVDQTVNVRNDIGSVCGREIKNSKTLCMSDVKRGNWYQRGRNKRCIKRELDKLEQFCIFVRWKTLAWCDSWFRHGHTPSLKRDMVVMEKSKGVVGVWMKDEEDSECLNVND